MAAFETHEVFNQSPPYEGIDLFASDAALQEAVRANGMAAPDAVLSAFGRHWGRPDIFEQARLANEVTPRLKSFDRQGRRSDTVEFHPAYHFFMAESMKAGLHCMTWRADASRAPAPAEVARAARYYMVAQVENGHMCPITMTRAAVAALGVEPALADLLMPKIVSHEYDPRFIPWPKKTAMTLGMGMTEKQGGTDVRANSTVAVRDGEAY
ncbi:MAG: DNA alkylation response protein, partial [Xanthobacteraceae bacterium]